MNHLLGFVAQSHVFCRRNDSDCHTASLFTCLRDQTSHHTFLRSFESLIYRPCSTCEVRLESTFPLEWNLVFAGWHRYQRPRSEARFDYFELWFPQSTKVRNNMLLIVYLNVKPRERSHDVSLLHNPFSIQYRNRRVQWNSLKYHGSVCEVVAVVVRECERMPSSSNVRVSLEYLTR